MLAAHWLMEWFTLGYVASTTGSSKEKIPEFRRNHLGVIDEVLQGKQRFSVPDVPADRWNELRRMSDFDWVDPALFK